MELDKSPLEVSKQICSLVVQYLAMLTGEDRVIPLDDLLRRLAAADAHVLLPALRSDGTETERRRDTMFRVLATLYFLIVFFRLDTQYSPLRVAMIKLSTWLVCQISCFVLFFFLFFFFF
jgi:hypothetical protein